jgi:hypothetical protein
MRRLALPFATLVVAGLGALSAVALAAGTTPTIGTTVATITYTIPTVTETVTVTGPGTITTPTTTTQATTTAPSPSYLLDEEFNGAAGSSPTSQWVAKGSATSPYKSSSGTQMLGFTDATEDGNGDLVVTARKNSSGVWQSAWLSSKIAVGGTPGQAYDIVARGELPCNTGGMWASPVWAWGFPYGAAPELENDVIEALGKDPPDVYHSTVHFAATSGAGATDQSGGPISTGVQLCGSYHTYESKVYPGRIEFWFDGQLEKTITTGDLTGISDFTAWKEAVEIELEMGGWGGTPSGSGPYKMLVDYVRVSKL